jgi:hypothetical protein
MNKNWWSLGLRLLPAVLAVLAVSHPAFAHWPNRTPDDEAPELDPRLAIEGIAVAGAAAALIWERVRRRR